MLSRNLEKSLHRALAQANERRHEYATLEHLLLALTEDQDAVAVLRGPARAVTEFRVTVPPGLTIAQIKGKLLAQLQRFNGPELDAALANPEVALKWAPPIRRFLPTHPTWDSTRIGLSSK